MQKDYNDIWLQAMDTLVAQRLSEVKFDETIVCTIVDASERANGRYTVTTNDQIKFIATSEKTNYIVDQQVYVLIPQGDYSQEKTIIGRYSSADDQKPIAYVSPLEKVVKMSLNYAEDSENNKWELIANGAEKEITRVFQNQNNQDHLYDSFCIKADFKCLLQDYNIIQGSYGLLVRIITQNEVVDCRMDARTDMFGNPFAYSFYYTQEQAYSIKLTAAIEKIAVKFYQTDDFKYFGDEGETLLEASVDVPNILMKNLEMYFGYNVETVEDNTVKIFTSDSENYTIPKGNDEDTSYKKTLNLVWYNKSENNEYIGFSDGEFDEEKAKKPLDDGQTGNYYWIEWKINNTQDVWTVLEQDKQDESRSSIKVSCWLDYSLTEFKAIVYRNGETYEDTITFRNSSLSSIINSMANLNLNLTIHHGENSLSAYPLYGPDGNLINGHKDSTPRKVYVTYESAIGAELGSFILSKATIQWTIPKNMTMIREAYSLPEGFQRQETETEITFFKTLGAEYGVEKDLTFVYRISNFYQPTLDNNIIKCKIIDKNENEYMTQLALAFSAYGTSGTSFTLIIAEENSKTAIHMGEDRPIENFEFIPRSYLYNSEYVLRDTSPNGKGVYPYGTKNYTTTPEWVLNSETNYWETRNIIEAYRDIRWATGSGTEHSVKLKSYYPIACTKLEYLAYSVPMYIYYDANGSNPSYFDGFMKIYNRNTGNVILNETLDLPQGQTNDYEFDSKHYRWGILHWEKNEDDDVAHWVNKHGNAEDTMGPRLTDTTDQSRERLIMPVLFFNGDDNTNIQGFNCDYAICLYNVNNDYDYIFTQPLIITRNQYGSTILNNWDGQIKISEEENYILSSMLGAGKKDDGNTFSGVLLGEFGKGWGRSDNRIGLYGFHQGVESFGFNIDGTAFLGKSNGGRILFDGNESTIKSANYELTENSKLGSCWDLDNGSLVMFGTSEKKNQGDYFKFNEDGKGQLLIKIKSANLELIDDNGDSKNITTIIASAEGVTSQVSSITSSLQNFLVDGFIEKTGSAYKVATYVIDVNKGFFEDVTEGSQIECTIEINLTTGPNTHWIGTNWAQASSSIASWTIAEKERGTTLTLKASTTIPYLIGEKGKEIPLPQHTNSHLIGIHQNFNGDGTSGPFEDITIHWIKLTRNPLPSNYTIESSFFTQNAQKIEAKVSSSSSGTSCSWSITPEGFSIYKGTSNINNLNRVLYVNEQGLNVTGNITATSLTIDEGATISGTLSANNISGGTISASNISLGSDNNTKFQVNTSGQIKAQSGTIGGWNITGSYIDSTVLNSQKRFFLASASDRNDNWICARNSEGTDVFKVSKDGQLYATGARIKGSLICNPSSNETIEFGDVIFGNTEYGALKIMAKASDQDPLPLANFRCGQISCTAITAKQDGSFITATKHPNYEVTFYLEGFTADSTKTQYGQVGWFINKKE